VKKEMRPFVDKGATAYKRFVKEMFLSLGGSIEEDSQGNRIGRIEVYRDLPIDPDIAMVMKGLFERAKSAEGR
jgi:hypothetical protein